MADRVGVINKGELIVTEKKEVLMNNLGSKQLILDLKTELKDLPDSLEKYSLKLSGGQLAYSYDPSKEDGGACELFDALKKENIEFSDITTKKSSLEEIFVELVKK